MRRYMDMSIRTQAEGKGVQTEGESQSREHSLGQGGKISKIHSSSLNSKPSSLLFICLVKSTLCLKNKPNLCVFEIWSQGGSYKFPQNSYVFGL